MSLKLRRNVWLAAVLALVVGAAPLANGVVRAEEPPSGKPQQPLEPVFDPVFSGQDPATSPKVPAATARKSVARANRATAGASAVGANRRPAGAAAGAAPGAPPKNAGRTKAGAARPPANGGNSPPVNNPPAGNPPAGGDDDVYPVPPEATVKRVQAVQKRIMADVKTMKGVLGSSTALQEDGTVVVRVYTNGIDKPNLPKTVDGVAIVPEVIGQFRPYQGTPARQRRLPRPIPMGTSAFIFDTDVCASGTYGCRLRGANNKYYGLSNNHVFALENEGDVLVSEITQPSSGDDNCPLLAVSENVIGRLAAFCPIVFEDDALNLIDAAVIISDAKLIGTTTLPDGYGLATSNTVTAFLGQRVQKYGRTTGYRTGIVTEIDAVSVIAYDAGDAPFVDQIGVTGYPDDNIPLGQPGDSGSLVVDMNGNPVGLLFAGGGFPVVRTLCNKIDTVLDYFQTALNDPTLAVDGSTTQIPPGKVGTGRPNQPSAPLLPTVP